MEVYIENEEKLSESARRLIELIPQKKIISVKEAEAYAKGITQYDTEIVVRDRDTDEILDVACFKDGKRVKE